MKSAFVSRSWCLSTLTLTAAISCHAATHTTVNNTTVTAKHSMSSGGSGASHTSDDAFDDPFAMDDDTVENTQTVSDPLEHYNRFMFNLNTGIDNAFARPLAVGYKKITPTPVRSGIDHFFNNLSEPVTAVNLLLQGRPLSSLKSLGRFGINTISTLGLADPASASLGLTTTKEDFGQTLGVWGVPTGPYLVLPFLGPSTLRDVGGRVVDNYGNPVSYTNTLTSVSLTGMKGINKRSKLLSFEGLVDATDYEVIRDVYLQKRAFDIAERGGALEQPSESGFDESFGD